jgi:branched-chain amino acid transport system permease protein
MKALCFGLFACAFALLLGQGGLLSFGHAAFFGSAAYVTGFMLKSLGMTPEIAIFGGTAAAGAARLHLRSHCDPPSGDIYFAMITLALSQIIYSMRLRATWTGGDNGLTNIPPRQPVRVVRDRKAGGALRGRARLVLDRLPHLLPRHFALRSVKCCA